MFASSVVNERFLPSSLFLCKWMAEQRDHKKKNIKNHKGWEVMVNLDRFHPDWIQCKEYNEEADICLRRRMLASFQRLLNANMKYKFLLETFFEDIDFLCVIPENLKKNEKQMSGLGVCIIHEHTFLEFLLSLKKHIFETAVLQLHAVLLMR